MKLLLNPTLLECPSHFKTFTNTMNHEITRYCSVLIQILDIDGQLLTLIFARQSHIATGFVKLSEIVNQLSILS